MNERGSVTIFCLLIASALVLAFALYTKDLQKHMIQTNALRRVERAGVNAQASYNKKLYLEYGLLGVEEDLVRNETEATLKSEMIGTSGRSLLPRSEVGSYTFDVVKQQDLLNLNGTLKQMKNQSLMFVPKSLLVENDYVKTLFEKAKRAKAKIKSLDQHLTRLKSLQAINKKLGEVNDRLKAVESWGVVEVSREGGLKISTEELEDNIRSLENNLKLAIQEMQSFESNLENEKQSLALNKDQYPDAFADKLTERLESAKLESENLFTDRIRVVGLVEGNSYVNQVRRQLEQFTSKTDRIDYIMETYGQGLASLYQAKDVFESYEKEFQLDFEDELQSIGSLERREAHDVKRDLQDDLNEFLDERFEDVLVDIHSQIPPSIDSGLKGYVADVLKYTLKNENETGEHRESSTLSNGYISREISIHLPSKSESKLDYIHPVDRLMLTEYILGAFRNRLSQQEEQGWDFYGKMDREAFFETGEVEYILVGNREEQMNRSQTVFRIYLLRDAANLVHVYTCKEKLKTAGHISSAVAWPTWVKPIVYNGLLIGWASLESGEDLKRLLKGEKIYTIKYDDDMWYTSIKSQSSSKGKVKKSSGTSGVNLSKSHQETLKPKKADERSNNIVSNEQGYVFYLRFMLNLDVKKSDAHILRCLDLIELNNQKSDAAGTSVSEFWTDFNIQLHWDAGRTEYEVCY